MALCMTRRQAVTAMVTSCLTAGGTTGCATPQALRLGIHPWPGYEPLYLAQELGWMPSGVALVRGGAASDSLKGLRSNELDAACLTLDEVLLARSEGMPLVVVAVLDESVGADQVLGRVPRPPRGWRGARVGFEPSTVGHLVFNLWLRHEGLNIRDVRTVHLTPPEQRAAWDAGQVDVVISYQPDANALRARGGVVLYDSSHFPSLVLDVLAVRSSRLGWQDEPLVEGLVHAHFRGLDHLRINPEDAMRRIARVQNTTYADTVSSFSGLNLPQVTVNRAMLRPGGQLVPVAERLMATMTDVRLLPGPVDLDGLGTDRFLPRG